MRGNERRQSDDQPTQLDWERRDAGLEQTRNRGNA
jgi:hypothetical protein